MYAPVLFIVWRDPQTTFALGDLDGLSAALARLDGVARALAHLRGALDADHPFAGDGVGPALTLELAFRDEAAFAAALPQFGDSLPAGPFEAQSMRGRWFETPDPDAAIPPCTLLVEYLGRCEDGEAWLDHYDAHHPAIMVRFPGVRDVATYRPAPGLAIPEGAARAAAMQRNKVVFDSPAALARALTSPIMREMRADYDAFPPFEGHATHFPTQTHDLLAPLTPFRATP